MIRLDAAVLKRDHGERSVRAYVPFEVLLAGLISLLWLSEILPATLAGTMPASIDEPGLPTLAIYWLDLGVIVPAFALTADWLYHRRPWGYAFTAVLLVKIATLGGAVLAMVVYLVRGGQAVPLQQIVIFGTLTAVSLWLMARFLLSISPESEPIAAETSADSGVEGGDSGVEAYERPHSGPIDRKRLGRPPWRVGLFFGGIAEPKRMLGERVVHAEDGGEFLPHLGPFEDLAHRVDRHTPGVRG